MRPSEFNFDRFNYHAEQQQARLRSFINNKERFLPIVQRPGSEHFTTASHSKEDSLEAQLAMLDESTRLKSDFGYNYLEPWHGVGVYAAAFGSKVIWYKHSAPQTLYAFDSVEQVRDIPYPDISKCDMLQMVLESIRYFREKTGDAIPISLTDTQSPNDTASLILDSCEFFAAALEEPEAIEHLQRQVTRLISEFSGLQRETIGVGNVAAPGHTVFCDTSFSGISISEDNMSFLSPEVFATSAMPYNSELSRHFGGIAIHSCGVVKHNLPLLLKTDGLKWVEFAVGYGDEGASCDPNPNDAADLLPHFIDTDVAVKVRVGPGELERVFPLLTPRVKTVVEVCTYGPLEQRNAQYEKAKEILLAQYDKQKIL